MVSSQPEASGTNPLERRDSGWAVLIGFIWRVARLRNPFADATKGDDLLPAGTEDYIHIRIQQRNGRKTLTTVQGIAEEYDKKKLVKAFKKANMSCVKVCVLLTVLALAVCVARPLSESRSEVGSALAQRERQREKAQAARIIRRDWMGSLTAGQRQFMSKYIPQVLAGLLGKPEVPSKRIHLFQKDQDFDM
ncbi:EIF1B factor, partial [Polyodon spathula]|nr:EIF1B factor [Polyodon spathula]